MPFFFDHYPYTNFHNVNLDWVLQAVKAWGALVEENNIKFHNLEEAMTSFRTMLLGEWNTFHDETQNEINQFEIWTQNYLQNLDVQEEINTKLDEMLSSGVLSPYFAPYIQSDVSDWLQHNITPTSPAIDASLTISGAGADAKVTGDKINTINGDLDTIGVKVSITSEDIEQGLISGSNGWNTEGNTFARTIDYIKVNKGDVYRNTSLIITPSVYFYTNLKVFVSPASGWLGNNRYICPDDGYIRIAYKTISSGYGTAMENISEITNNNCLFHSTSTLINKLHNGLYSLGGTLSHLLNIQNVNMFDEHTIVDGTYTTDGSFDATFANWSTSDYILIDNTKHYELYSFCTKNKKPSYAIVTIFNSAKEYVFTLRLQQTGINNTTIFGKLSDYTFTNDAYYIRISSANTYILSWMLVESDYIPLMYIDHETDLSFIKSNFKRRGTIKSFAKQGYNTLDKYTNRPQYPHCSIYSFLASLYLGFDALWYAVICTSDGVPLICHNNDISTVAVNDDGTAINSPYNITEHTYSEIMTFDFGQKYGSMYSGLRVLTLEEGIKFAKYFGVDISIEFEVGESAETHALLCNIIKKYGMDKNVSIFSYGTTYLQNDSISLPYATLYKNAGVDETATLTSASAVSQLKTDLNEVYVICQFGLNLSQTAIDTLITQGVRLAYSNPNYEPLTIQSFFETDRNNYADSFITRIVPAWESMRRTVV